MNTSDCRKPSGGTWNPSTSDARTKTDVEDYTKGLSALLDLRPITYRYNDVTSLGRSTNYAKFVGFIAQEVEQTDLSSMVMDSGEGFLTVDTSELTYALINAIKELTARIAELENRIQILESRTQ